MELQRVVAELTSRQRIAQMNDEEFAKVLGVSRQMWNFVRNGQAEPGLLMWQKVVRAYPDLAEDIVSIYTDRLYVKKSREQRLKELRERANTAKKMKGGNDGETQS